MQLIMWLTSEGGGEAGAGSAAIGVGGVGDKDGWTIAAAEDGEGVVPAVGPVVCGKKMF